LQFSVVSIGMDNTSSVRGQSVGDVGEFELIDRLAGLVSGSAAVVGIGDDAAVLDVGDGDYVLATVDMMVQGAHFELGDTDPEVIGRRAIAMNVSDIAAMGGEPTFALISLALPPECPVDFVERIYHGLVYQAGVTGAGIAGGNVTRTSGPICIDVTMLGRVPRDEVVLRSGARPGDILVVTGTLGAAAARRVARRDGRKDDPSLVALVDALPSGPIARVHVARRLAAGHIPRAMLDLSDGLAGDIRHLCSASSVGAAIYQDRLPISAETRAICASLDVSPVPLALSGGEDYELLIALSAENLAGARQAAGGVPLTVIGEIVSTAGEVTLVAESGDRQELSLDGWTHF
jgi:thiamine-monophosphate kinase